MLKCGYIAYNAIEDALSYDVQSRYDKENDKLQKS